MKNYDKLLYWIRERESVRKAKESRAPKPWSEDLVFQRVYFCNVRREDDKTTRYIRNTYSPHVGHPLFVHNIILTRMLNWPITLEHLGYLYDWDTDYVSRVLHERSAFCKVWGNAYIVSTCGRSMDKIDYLTQIVMESVEERVPHVAFENCEQTAAGLQTIEGISTFMAGQVIADLKNTPGHPLQDAYDWWDFALPGPGSVRGMDWVYGEKVPAKEWHSNLLTIRDAVDKSGVVGDLCAQDMQNCLCEFDKYMRVSTGAGRSKRGYDGGSLLSVIS